MEDRKTITLDLTGCNYLMEIHEKIKNAFDFPEWYGRNWSAFSDLLCSECDADVIDIIGINTLSHEFDEQIQIMKDILSYEQNVRRNHNEKLIVNYIDS